MNIDLIIECYAKTIKKTEQEIRELILAKDEETLDFLFVLACSYETLKEVA